MVKTFHIKDTKLIMCYQHGIGTKHRICPDCVNHKRGEPTEFYDCKNVFIDDDNFSVGQCMCYSIEHGKRE